MRTIFVGMDVSKDDFKAAVKDEQNSLIGPVKTYRHDRPSLEVFDRDIGAIKEQLRCGAVFGMESTGIYHLSVYQHLVEAGEHVKLFNALELKRFKSSIRKTKTGDSRGFIIGKRAELPSYLRAGTDTDKRIVPPQRSSGEEGFAMQEPGRQGHGCALPRIYMSI